MCYVVSVHGHLDYSGFVVLFDELLVRKVREAESVRDRRKEEFESCQMGERGSTVTVILSRSLSLSFSSPMMLGMLSFVILRQ